MNLEWSNIVSAGGIAAIVTSFIAIYKAIRFRQEDASERSAEVSEKYQTVASKSAEHASQLLDRVIKLESEATALRVEIEDMNTFIAMRTEGIRILLKQLREAGIEPAWIPPDWTRPRPK